MTTFDKVLMVFIVLAFCTATFFVTKAIYNKSPEIPPSQVITVKDTVTVRDTLEIKLKGKIDTVKITDTLTQFIDKPINVITAQSDTVIDKDNYKLELSTVYLFPPVNEFRHKINIAYKELLITQEQPPAPEKSLWDNFCIGAGVGVGYGIKSKEFEPHLSVGVYYKIK